MAIVQSIAVGKARGSAGNVTFSTVKGRVIMKEKPVFVANPKTEAQQAQRSALARTLKIWQKIGFLAKDGWTRLNAYASPYNQFLSNNIPLVKELPGTVDDILEQDLKGLQISSGSLKELSLDEIVDDPEGIYKEVTVSLLNDDLKVGDKIKAIVFDKDSKKAYSASAIITNDDFLNEVITVNVPVENLSETVNINYAFYAVSADGKLSSSSYFK